MKEKVYKAGTRLIAPLAFVARFTPFRAILESIDTGILYILGVGNGADFAVSGESVLFRLLRDAGEGDVFDVGANTGVFLSRYLGTCDDFKRRIHCFEPGSVAFEKLSARYASVENLVLNKVALGNERGRLRLHYDKPGSTEASLVKRDFRHISKVQSNYEEVNVLKLDDYCLTCGVNSIGLLKIDVEGHEMSVLRGAEKMLRSGSIAICSFEVGGASVDSRTFFKDIFYYLDKFEYTIYRIMPLGGLYQMPEYQHKYEQFRTSNYVAIQKGKIAVWSL